MSDPNDEKKPAPESTGPQDAKDARPDAPVEPPADADAPTVKHSTAAPTVSMAAAAPKDDRPEAVSSQAKTVEIATGASKKSEWKTEEPAKGSKPAQADSSDESKAPVAEAEPGAAETKTGSEVTKPETTKPETTSETTESKTTSEAAEPKPAPEVTEPKPEVTEAKPAPEDVKPETAPAAAVQAPATAETAGEATESDDQPAGSDAKTVVMKIQQRPDKSASPAPADKAPADDDAADTVAMQNDEPANVPPPPPAPNVAGADAETVAMKIVPKPQDDAKTTAIPVQPRPDQQATQKIRTDAAAPRPAPMTKPPMTPRPAPGPKQPGKQGPPQQQQPPQPRRVPQAQSPADVQMTLPVQSVFQPAGQQQQRPHQPPPMAAPQRVEPAAPTATPDSGKSKRLLIGAGAAAAVVIALIVGGAAFANRSDGSPEAQVRSAIGDYTSALKDGDLAALRNSTCGALHEFYAKLPEADFAGVHKLSAEQKTIPVIDEVDAIQITDSKALAQATVYTAADPSKKSARTFDLERTDSGWKVCDPPAGS
ncbi:hypothetical protein [Nocardia sp. XZ_19_385]|uniref:Rv0361 family membrane protein n=1 Tax=Nocardia sp. XZ_19_385 TaxID=2769488 RepID=UPI001E2CAD13|nr:hypothetical protein [Nocardia sp. XZ_19_385]